MFFGSAFDGWLTLSPTPDHYARRLLAAARERQ